MILSKIKYLTFNTIIINFRLFPLNIAIKFPIFIASNVLLKNLNGKIILNTQIKTGMIKIGYGDVAIFDKKRSRGILQNYGTIIFKGNAFLGHGSKINCGPNGILEFGNNFTITAESTIIANKNISFGDNCLISWDNLIMDDDFHSIYNDQREKINNPSPIMIGNHVWIGCRSLILKGSEIPNNCVIAAGSIITKKHIGTNTIIGGTPAKTLKSNIIWE